MAKLLGSALLAAALFTAPARAQERFADVTDPAERALLPAVAQAVTASKPTLSALDALLAKLGRPTSLRAIVQARRAHLLVQANRGPEAMAAIDEAVRLAPDQPTFKLLAVHILPFQGAAQRAADLWMELSRQAQPIALQAQDYTLRAIAGRLTDLGDMKRRDALLARMAEIGFAQADAATRSAAVGSRLEAAVAAGRPEEARGLITGVSEPGQMLRLYVDKRYQALWPAIAEWAGPSFEPLARRHLEEVRREWWRSPTFVTAATYASELLGYRAPAAVVALFLPMLEKATPSGDNTGIEFLAPKVARALAVLGRVGDAEALLARMDPMLPANQRAQRLNFSANIVNLQARNQRWAEVVTGSERWTADAKALGPEVNSSALLQVEGLRACALARLGRSAEATLPIANVTAARRKLPWIAGGLHACLGQEPEARALLLEAFAEPDLRGWALGVVQPSTGPEPLPASREDHAFWQRVKADPAVLSAAAQVGRVLPAPVLGELPKGFDPLLPSPQPPGHPDSI